MRVSAPKCISQIKEVSDEVIELDKCLENAGKKEGWGYLLIRGELDKFWELDVLDELPENLRDKEYAKKYIYKKFTESPFSNTLSPDVQDVLARKMDIQI